ncbi:hypothetical protein [Gilliamella sp. wkB112]|uniref:hypothetical protein n=1 Tax=Gilliamella sp. wkB112 TaxID=3120257 RepID=UPI00080DCE09|nr:hypothetical protein [Gilliamella apicola]OCG03180.1 hypothetical protein A9G12_09735 [Gilliamella apicola]
MTLDIYKIEIIFNLIINKLKSDGIHKISFDYDFLLNSINKDIIINGDLRKLSHLLRYIADKLDL